ncbi:MAG: radical SAM protein [Nitrospirae bacterium]|nr:radical SAM protein [Nitrospirota bacterium]
MGYIPPLTLLTVAAVFEKTGADVQLLDMDAEELTYIQALERIDKFSPDLLGFTVSTYSFHSVLRWIKKYKHDTGIPIIVGGMHAGLYAEEIMTYPEIDYLVTSEGEEVIPDFVQAFNKDRNFTGIKSLGYRENGGVIIDKTARVVNDLDSVPFPARHLIKNELYSNILTKKKNFTAMLSARGCPFKCSFCNQNKTKYRVRSAQNFFAEIKENYEKYGIKEFDIYDTTFTANKNRVFEICKMIENEGIDVSWTIRSRVDTVNEQLLNTMKAAGCHAIMYGIESSNQEILKRMGKDISLEKIRSALNYTKKIGIETLGFFMIGYPGETLQTIEDTIRFSLELPLDYAQYTVIVPYPDAEIYEYYRNNGMEDYWRQYTLDASKERKLELLGTSVTREQAGLCVAEAYRRFYFRPKIILRRAAKIKSFSEFKHMSVGAFGILKNLFSYGKKSLKNNIH